MTLLDWLTLPIMVAVFIGSCYMAWLIQQENRALDRALDRRFRRERLAEDIARLERECGLSDD